MDKLTAKQTAFKDYFTDTTNKATFNNGTAAARAAGAQGKDNVVAATASRWLRNVKVQQAIEEIRAERRAKNVANRQQRQNFWTRVMSGLIDIPCTMTDRLRASELLGRSEADFVDVTQRRPDQQQPQFTAEELARLKAEAKALTARDSIKEHNLRPDTPDKASDGPQDGQTPAQGQEVA